MIFLTDNSFKLRSEITGNIDDLREIADISIDSLHDGNGRKLWLFPLAGDRYDDKIQDETILSFRDGKVYTGNIMGFIGFGNTKLSISSRFSKDSDKDYFLQYMLQQVFSINLFDLKSSFEKENMLDITPLVFPYFLQKALSQGLYREYTRNSYNDSKIRGALDLPRHIKENYPFKNGKMAYTTREFTFDNAMTQLIRHTIEFIKTDSKLGQKILTGTPEMRDAVKMIYTATPSYRKGARNKVILYNLKPKIHPYYYEYRPLQQICIKILRNERISFGQSEKEMYGILFYGAWLWEEYLNKVFQRVGYDHPENRTGKGKIYVFKDRKNKYGRFPDFIKDGIVADAKYKNLVRKANDMVFDNISRDDIHQMISYIHITHAEKGVFVNPESFSYIEYPDGITPVEMNFPIRSNMLYTSIPRVGNLDGYGGEIYIIDFNIPQHCKSEEEFRKRMRDGENALERKLKYLDC